MVRVLMGEGARSAQLSVLAGLAGLSLPRVYELFRLPSAPSPVGFVASVPVFDVDAALAFLSGRGQRSSAYNSGDG